MTASNDTARQGRRRFLKGVMAVGGTTVLVAVGREAMSGDAPDADVPHEQGAAVERDQGYHVTDHIASYYEKARF